MCNGEHVKYEFFSGKTKPDTFEDCVNQYARMIKTIMKKLQIYKNYEEFYQVGQIALWMAYQHYESEKGSFSNYAFLTVRGHLLNELSKTVKYDERNVLFDQQLEEAVYCDEVFLLEDFMILLKGISPLQKQILVERFYYHREFSQIAKKLKMNESSVRSSYRYALKRLRELK